MIAVGGAVAETDAEAGAFGDGDGLAGEEGLAGETLVLGVAVDGPACLILGSGGAALAFDWPGLVLDDGADGEAGLFVVSAGAGEVGGDGVVAGRGDDFGFDAAEDEVAVEAAAETLVRERGVGEDLEEDSGERAGRERGVDFVGVVRGIGAAGEP